MKRAPVLSAMGVWFWDAWNAVPGSPRRVSKKLRVELLEERRLLSAVPNAYEQYMLALINRARSDPAAEAARGGIDLNEGLSAGTISTAAKQPLAFNPCLIESAELHSQWMLDTDTFSHTGSGGTSPGARMTNAGYTFSGSWGWAENIAWQGTTATPDITTFVGYLENALFVDAGIDGRGHRTNLMSPTSREVGVGVRTGLFGRYNAVMSTQDFARSGSSVFLTGVVYDDGLVLANSFYTPGEGLGGVSISAKRQADQAVFSTTTWASGGYTLALPAGTYSVTVSGAALGGNYHRDNVTIGSQNVELDVTRGNTTVPTAPVITGITTDTGASPTDGVTSDATLAFAGVAEANSTVTIFNGETNVGTATANGSGVWLFNYTSTTLADGTYQFTATATDQAGATSPKSAVFPVSVDQTPPQVTVTSLSTNAMTPVIAGTVSDGTLQVVVNGKTYSVGDGRLTISNTAWTLQIPAADALSAGMYEVSATAVDVAGNVGRDTTSKELRIGIDDDADGAADATEMGAPHGGDGNQDGQPDSQQLNVASFLSPEDGTYLTLAAPDGRVLSRVCAAGNPSPDDTPPGAQFPLGFVAFALANGTSTTTVTLFVESGTELNTYY